MEDTHYDYDVLVVGAGNAALSAAHSALEGGGRVGVLEKAPRLDRGGNSALTAQFRFTYENPDQLMALLRPRDQTPENRREIADRLPSRSKQELWDEVMLVTEGLADPDLLRVHVDESYSTISWLHAKGHDWVPEFTGTTGNIVYCEGAGYGLQQRNFGLLERESRATVHYETAATDLLVDSSGKVSGVAAVTPQGRKLFSARAVVLASGGFEANAEMRARYLGPRWDFVYNRGVPYNTGDGLRMALAIGAMPYGGWGSCHASPNDWAMPLSTPPSARDPEKQKVVTWDRYLYPYSIMVNSNGQRFVDEADNTRALTYAKMGGAILAQPGGKAYQIIDAKVRAAGLVPPNYATASRVSADDLGALAKEIGVPGASLEDTVRRFNAAVPSGRKVNPSPFHPDGVSTEGLTPPKSNFAMTIDEPPFEAFPVRCGITFTFGGIRIDPNTAQVLHVSGSPIGGLYSAGEMVGGLWYWNYPSGSGMMAGATFGKRAGKSAAKAAQK